MSKPFILTVLMLITLNIYLFVSAPPPLANERPTGTRISVRQVFAIAEAENDVVRNLWTKDVVGAGSKVGLAFDEDWREKDVEAGPLPALFLRETANSLEKNRVRLSLYLGSDYPISSANRFKGLQMQRFQAIRQTQEPQFFHTIDTGLYTAMFADIAVAEVCVSCHNEHEDSPKSDWKLNDVMGATTWAYPNDTVTVDELMQIVFALRKGFRDSYTAYLSKIDTFARRPVVGDKWPVDGFYLPSADVFMQEALKRASADTLSSILAAIDQEKETD